MLLKRTFFSFGTVLLCFIIAFNANAQQPDSVTITGTVVDTAQTPIPGTTIAATVNDSIINNTSASESGAFNLTIPKSGKIALKFSSAGYQISIKPFSINDAVNDTINMDTIALHQETKELKGVTVTAKTPLIKQEIDKLVYNTEVDPESKFRSVLDIMRKVPYLSVDGQENLLLKGNSSYRILINGKPSGILDSDPKQFLKSLPASTIQNIEVYTTPPSKYDAEGLGGVINIITNKKIGEGYKSSVNLGYRFPVGGPELGFSFTATHKKLGVELYGGINASQTPWETTISSRNSFGADHTALTVSSESNSNYRGRRLGTQFSYEIDSLRLLTAQINFNGSNSKGNTSRFSQLFVNNSIYQQFAQASNYNDVDNGFDGGMNYQRSFKKDKSKLLTVSYQYRQYKTDKSNFNYFTDTVNYSYPNFNQYNHPFFNEHTGQLDYVQNIKKVKLEAGLKAIYRKNTSDFTTALENIITGSYENDPTRQDFFQNEQTILSAYNTYSFSLKEWSFKAGARAEETLNNIDFRSTNTKVNSSYFNLVPAIVINKNNKNGSYFNWGYNQRLKRPGIYRMNPFINQSNPNFIETGNPNLEATTMHNFSMSYGINKKQSYNGSLSYAFMNNMDLKISRYDPDSKITYITYENSGKVAALMLDANANLAITKGLRTTINGQLAKFWIRLQDNGNITYINPVLYKFFISNAYSFEKNWTANATVYVNGRNLANAQAQGYIKGYISTSLSLSKTLIKKKLTLSAFVDNPFTKFRNNELKITSGNFVETNLWRQHFRQFGFSANYNFGKLKKDIQKNKRSINNNDIAN